MEEFPDLTTALGEELGVLAEGDAPPSSVNAAEAVRRGQARLRRRRSAVLGAVAAIAVTAGALGSLRAGGGGDAASVLPAASLSSGPAAPSRLPSPTVSGSPWADPSSPLPLPTKTTVGYPGKDPLSGMPRFGWLPDVITTVEYSLQPNGVTVRATSPITSTNRGTDPFMALTLYPAGVTPGSTFLPPQVQPKFVPAPAINGQEARWVTADDPAYAQGDELQWKTPSGQWADLNSGYLKGEDRQRVPLRVAAAVDAQPHDTPLPVRLTGLPAEYTVSSATFDRSTTDPGKWSLHLNFSVSYDKYFVVSVQPDGPSASASPTAPGGMPVHERPQVCKTEQGLRICVIPLQDPNVVFAAIGGMDAMLPKITGLGTDENNWTTGVIG